MKLTKQFRDILQIKLRTLRPLLERFVSFLYVFRSNLDNSDRKSA